MNADRGLQKPEVSDPHGAAITAVSCLTLDLEMKHGASGRGVHALNH